MEALGVLRQEARRGVDQETVRPGLQLQLRHPLPQRRDGHAEHPQLVLGRHRPHVPAARARARRGGRGAAADEDDHARAAVQRLHGGGEAARGAALRARGQVVLRPDGERHGLARRGRERDQRVLGVGRGVEHDEAELGRGREVFRLQDQVLDDGPHEVPLRAHHGRVLQHEHVARRRVARVPHHGRAPVDRRGAVAGEREVRVREDDLGRGPAPAPRLLPRRVLGDRLGVLCAREAAGVPHPVQQLEEGGGQLRRGSCGGVDRVRQLDVVALAPGAALRRGLEGGQLAGDGEREVPGLQRR